MRMAKFRVQHFQKVHDSGWITCKELTVFVGKNESGKSSIFRGLSKLNPSDGEKYDGLKEFPRRRYVKEFRSQDWVVSSVEFELTEQDKKGLAETAPIFGDVSQVMCHRHYSGKLDVEFSTFPRLDDISTKSLLALLSEWQSALQSATAPEGKGDSLAGVKTKLLPFITQKIEQFKYTPSEAAVPENMVTEITNGIMTQLNESWQKDLFKDHLDKLARFRSAVVGSMQIGKAKSWVEKNLPKFVYFDRCDVIDSAIHVPTFLGQLRSNASAPRVLSTKTLFQHVGLDLDNLLQLDPTQPNKAVDELRRFGNERAILMSSASDAMTQRFAEGLTITPATQSVSDVGPMGTSPSYSFAITSNNTPSGKYNITISILTDGIVATQQTVALMVTS
jgi:energy-coupling factor transporter ATP-binding protein EcfA2